MGSEFNNVFFKNALLPDESWLHNKVNTTRSHVKMEKDNYHVTYEFMTIFQRTVKVSPNKMLDMLTEYCSHVGDVRYVGLTQMFTSNTHCLNDLANGQSIHSFEIILK